jgi:hypothetical protein
MATVTLSHMTWCGKVWRNRRRTRRRMMSSRLWKVAQRRSRCSVRRERRIPPQSALPSLPPLVSPSLLTQACSLLTCIAENAGGKITSVILQWSSLLRNLATQGIYISDWDERIPRPGEVRKKQNSKGRGIGALPIAKIRLLRELCENPETAPKFVRLPSPSGPRCRSFSPHS